MEFLEMDMKMAKCFNLKLRISSLPTAISDSMNFSAPCSITRDGDKIFISFFIPKMGDYEKIMPFFPILDIEERRLYYMARKKISDERLSDFIRRLDDIEGLEIPYIKIEGKYLSMTGYMLESSTMAFSDLIADYVSTNGIIAKVSLKPSNGIFDYMKYWCANLKSIVISLPMSVFGHYRVIKALKNTGAIAQFIDNYSHEGQFRLIIFSDKNYKEFDSMKEISRENHIYVTRTDEDILNILAAKAMKKNITWNFLFMYADESKLYINFILPDFRAREYFNLIVDTEMDLKHLEWVTLEYYGDAVNKDSSNILIKRESNKN